MNRLLEVRSIAGTRGVFARGPFPRGAHVLALPHIFVGEPTRYTVQVDHGRHVDTRGDVSSLLNHNCQPNCVFEVGQHVIKALRPIAAGEELTINYLASELILAAPFECDCGSPSCLHQIRGFQYLNAASAVP